MVFTKHGGIDSPRLTQKMRPVLARGRMFVFGDSISTIRRPTTEADSVNNRFVRVTGWNLWDWFRFSFDPVLQMDLTTNYAQEGAFATRDRLDNPTWARMTPVPGFNSQINQMIADNPLGTINPLTDIAGIYFGTNDGMNNDGGTVGTYAQVRAAIVAGINRLIAHGFNRFAVVNCERFYSANNPGFTSFDAMTADLDAIVAGNRAIRLSWINADWAMLEQSNPRLDPYHPNDVAHRRLGEILTAAYKVSDLVNLTSDFRLSAFSNNLYPNRTSVIGFSNFNADATLGSVCRVEFADINNSIEANRNRRLTFRSYNGIDICGAWEAQTPVAPAGGARYDPVVRIRGNFYEHNALLKLDHVGGVPKTQSPFILANDGTADRFKVSNDGTIVINAPTAPNNILKADVNSVERFKVASDGTIVINAPTAPNNPIKVDINGTERFKIDSNGLVTIATQTTPTPYSGIQNALNVITGINGGNSAAYGRIVVDDRSNQQNAGFDMATGGVNKWGFFHFNEGTQGSFAIYNYQLGDRVMDVDAATKKTRLYNTVEFPAGNVTCGNNKVLSYRVTGLGAPTGGFTVGAPVTNNSIPTLPNTTAALSTTLNFTTTSATTATCATAIATIINILRFHGLAQ